MQRKLWISSLIVGLMLGNAALAAGPLKLTIDDAVNRAFATNPAIKVAGYNLNAARASLNAARMGHGITISGNWSLNRSGTTADKYTYVDGYIKTYGRGRSDGIKASIPVYTGGEISGAVITQKANYQSALAGKQKAYNDMHYNVVNAYYNLLLQQDLEQVARDSVATLQKHLQHVQDSYEVGVVAKVDVLRSEVEMADAEQSLIKAENARKIAMHNLNKIIGLPLETELEPTDTLSNEDYDRDLESCLEYAALNRPDLEQSRQSVRSAKGGVRSARSGYMPKVSVSAGKQWNYTSEPGDPSNTTTWSAGVSASWNAFDSGVTAYKVHAAEMNARVAKEKLRDAENDTALDVRNTYYNLQESKRRIHTTNVAVSKAQEDYDIAQLRYENGVGTNTDVLDAQVALNTAKTNYIQACYDFNTNKIALDNAIGVPFQSPLEKTTVVKVKTKKKK